MDEGTASKTDLMWARILVKLNNNTKYDAVNLIAGSRVYEVQLWWEFQPTVMEVTKKSCRDFGGPEGSGEEDDCDTRAKGRVNNVRKENCRTGRNGRRVVGNRTGMGNCDAAECLDFGKWRGGRIKVGDKEKHGFQIDEGSRGRNGKTTNAIVEDSLKDRAGPYSAGAAAQIKGKGKINGFLKGPTGENRGEKNVWPMGRSRQSIPRSACKGESEEKMGTVTLGREKATEGEMMIGEKRGFHGSKSSQDQGRCKGYKTKHVSGRKERNTSKGLAGSGEKEDKGEGSCNGASEQEQETIESRIPEKTSTVAEVEVVGEKVLCVAVESAGSILRGASQVGGYMRGWPRNLEMSTGDLWSEVVREDELRAGKRVGTGEIWRGSPVGTRSKVSGRVCHSYRKEKEQEEMDPGPGQFLGAGTGSGTERASGRGAGPAQHCESGYGTFLPGGPLPRVLHLEPF